MQAAPGTTIKGKITRITGFGAFVAIEGGGTGMIHISEISNSYVKDIKDYLTEGQDVEAFVISCDENGRLSLSLRRLTPKKNSTAAPPDDCGRKDSGDGTFEDMMQHFKAISDDKLVDLKRGYESKRGTGKRRK